MKHARNIWKKHNLQNEVKMKNKFVPHKITLSLQPGLITAEIYFFRTI
jgi:hypothetical protein